MSSSGIPLNIFPIIFILISLFFLQNLLQESVSIINERLTLNKFYSDELDKLYSSIYRVPEDYENLIKQYLQNYEILKSDLLLNEKTGARKETNAKYWILRRP